jgi:hypothetical protein
VDVAEDRQRLDVTDRVILGVDRALRGMGYPGFDTQMFVWLSGRLDAGRLRQALDHLGASYPVITARLRDEPGGGPCWCYRAGARPALQEARLSSAAPREVLDHAARLLSSPHTPEETDPLRFHLLHRSDGRDVFLVQYNHTLMDNSAAPLVLRALQGLIEFGPAAALPTDTAPPNLIARHLRTIPLERRRRAGRKLVEQLRLSLSSRAVMLSGGQATRPARVQFGIITRALDADAARTLEGRVRAVCGLPSISMAGLAAAFRAIDRLTGRADGRGDHFAAGIGIDLGLRGAQGPLFRNLMSLVPIHARADDLADPDRLLRYLTSQMRDRLTNDVDLGMLRLLTLFSRQPRRTAWVLDWALWNGFSLWYAYFGALDRAGHRLGDVAIEDLHFAGPSWSPMGVTLLANHYRGRLLLQATYVPPSVSEARANEFLDEVVRELHAEPR